LGRALHLLLDMAALVVPLAAEAGKSTAAAAAAAAAAVLGLVVAAVVETVGDGGSAMHVLLLVCLGVVLGSVMSAQAFSVV
jgi:hypothetical protein